MAKSRPAKKSKGLRSKKQKAQSGTDDHENSPEYTASLLAEAAQWLGCGEPEKALKPAKSAVERLITSSHEGETPLLLALELLGETYLELGDVEHAHEYFSHAAELDPDGTVSAEEGGGADKFLTLAQICEEGGAQSVAWLTKGCKVLRREISELEGESSNEANDQNNLAAKRVQLANALCATAEVYMTDLSWEADAEARCEALVTEACMIAPESPEPLQTLASVRISQTDMDAARAALSRSIAMWKDLDLDKDTRIPDFPTRISLSRLLIEVEMYDEATEVLDRLVAEDDQSVEAWYLGGWCIYLMGQELRQSEASSTTASQEFFETWKQSRRWFRRALTLIDELDYEDQRLYEHASELVADINRTIEHIFPEDDDDGEDDADGWEDEDSDGDGHEEVMTDL